MDGYLTPGEIASLKAGMLKWIVQEFSDPADQWDYAPLEEPPADDEQPSVDSPYEDLGDDSTTFGGYGEWD